MKKLKFIVPSIHSRFINRLPEGPEAHEQQDSRAQAERDPRQVMRQGVQGVNAQLETISTLSPDAAAIVGDALPNRIRAGITNPEDARRLGEAALLAQSEIETQLNGSVDGSPDYPPEAYAEVAEWFKEVQVLMAEADAALAAQAQAHPDNEDLQRQHTAFSGMVEDVRDLSEQATTDLAALERAAAEGGTTGPIGEQLAAVAKGEVGKVTSDAEGNAKYTPGGVDQAWCADFVNYCLEQAGGQGTGSSMAQSFVQGEGYGHVAIVTEEDGGTVGGNEGNAVNNQGNAAKFEHAISAEAVTEGRFDKTKSAADAEVGDIVVRSRDAGPGQSTADQHVS